MQCLDEGHKSMDKRILDPPTFPANAILRSFMRSMMLAPQFARGSLDEKSEPEVNAPVVSSFQCKGLESYRVSRNLDNS